MTTVLLFGAGASFGGGDFLPERPPLGNQLFAELSRCFKGSWGALPTDAAAAFTDNFERGMEMVWENWSHAVPTLMQHMAIYFVQFRPRSPGTTLYCRLIQGIEAANARARVLLSTLNYECLLEHSVWSTGAPVNYGDFPTSDGITVWKLHGGCNLLPAGISATRSISFTSGVSFGTSIRPARDLNEVLEFCLADNALPPVMCMFMRRKPVQVSSASVAALQNAWQEKAMKADRVAVVGVFPNSEDTHLWDTLASIPGELLYVGAAEPFREWARQHRQTKPTHILAERFDQAFNDLLQRTVS